MILKSYVISDLKLLLLFFLRHHRRRLNSFKVILTFKNVLQPWLTINYFHFCFKQRVALLVMKIHCATWSLGSVGACCPRSWTKFSQKLKVWSKTNAQTHRQRKHVLHTVKTLWRSTNILSDQVSLFATIRSWIEDRAQSTCISITFHCEWKIFFVCPALSWVLTAFRKQDSLFTWTNVCSTSFNCW